MSDAFDLSQLAVPRFDTSRPAESPAVPSLGEMTRVMAAVVEEQRREHRTLFCRPECVDRIRAELEVAGFAPWVTVVASELVDEGVVLVAHTPIVAGEVR